VNIGTKLFNNHRNEQLFNLFIYFRLPWWHAAGGIVFEALRYKPGRSRDRFPMVSLDFFIDIILPVALCIAHHQEIFTVYVQQLERAVYLTLSLPN
jgi:hypothetical protein